MIRNGWEIYFHSQLFGEQRRQLREEVKKLKAELSTDEFVTHPKVKLLAAVMAGIKEKIALDPFASHFALQGPLKYYGRIKGMGLPPRYRLFFRAFEEQNRRMLIVLWLGYPRKEGDKNDCYTVFTRKINNGEIPDGLEALLKEVES
ncbi:MAG: type II toxin-antitoxin system YhaV family toxin [Synechococcaceae cyanobacterium SM2_3_2]|nr:type II toxin-antitoxin system YhaV family toxin [Synechococcaceae cyanobacterium SM2_3_2]